MVLATPMSLSALKSSAGQLIVNMKCPVSEAYDSPHCFGPQSPFDLRGQLIQPSMPPLHPMLANIFDKTDSVKDLSFRFL